MEARVTALETGMNEVRARLTKIETKLDFTATKEDLHRELHSTTWKFIGAVTTLGIAVVGAMVWITQNVQ